MMGSVSLVPKALSGDMRGDEMEAVFSYLLLASSLPSLHVFIRNSRRHFKYHILAPLAHFILLKYP